MMRIRLKPDRRSAGILAAALVGLAAGGGALLYQQESSLANVVKQLQDAEKQRDESARVASRLADTEMRYKQDTEHLKFLEASLPSMEYVPTLLKQIEQLCRDTHNEVRSIRPDAAPAKPVRAAVRRTDPEAQGDDANKPAEKPKPEPYDRLQIQVALTSGFPEYQSFLQQLTKFPKIIAVDRVQLRPRTDNDHPSGAPHLDVDMQLTAFILKDTAAAPAPDPVAAGAPTGQTTPAAVSAAVTGGRQVSTRPDAGISAFDVHKRA
jgi:Tfp pilus assembly protein PilO